MPETIWVASNLSFPKASNDNTSLFPTKGSRISSHSRSSTHHLVIPHIASSHSTNRRVDVLEQSNIAWPNQAMWRQVSLVGPYAAQHAASPRKISGEDELHSHSPRRGSMPAHPYGVKPLSALITPGFHRPSSNPDPFTDKVQSDSNGWRQASVNDVLMPDYASSSSGLISRQTSRQVMDDVHPRRFQDEYPFKRSTDDPYPGRRVTDPMSVTGIESLTSESHRDSYSEAVGPHPPANTPQTEETLRTHQGVTFETALPRKPTSRKTTKLYAAEDILPFMDLVTSGLDEAAASGTVLIQQRPSIHDTIKGRKEHADHSPNSPGSASPPIDEHMRKVSQAFDGAANANNKRQRVVTPAASKAIDEEDEPRSSPTARKVSRTNAKEAHTQKRVLGNITNNI